MIFQPESDYKSIRQPLANLPKVQLGSGDALVNDIIYLPLVKRCYYVHDHLVEKYCSAKPVLEGTRKEEVRHKLRRFTPVWLSPWPWGYLNKSYICSCISCLSDCRPTTLQARIKNWSSSLFCNDNSYRWRNGCLETDNWSSTLLCTHYSHSTTTVPSATSCCSCWTDRQIDGHTN